MANPSLQIGNDNWAIKEDNLLGYSTAGTRFVPQPITMTRATLGTRVNPSGLVEDVELLGSELVTCGDFSCATPSTYWTATNAVISFDNNQLTVDDTAGAGGDSRGSQTITTENGKTYRLTFNRISTTSLFYLGVGSGAGYNNIFYSSLGTDTGEYTLDFTATSSSTTIAFISGGNGITVFSNISVKEATIDNLPRVDYTDGTSSLLVEPQRTNTLTYSEDFSQWTIDGNASITSNATTSPDGTENATKLIAGSSSGRQAIKLNNTSSGDLAVSVFAKKGEYSVIQLSDARNATAFINFDLLNGSVGSSSVMTGEIVSLGNDWYKCIATYNSASNIISMRLSIAESSTSARLVNFSGNGTDGIYIWGAQLEEGSYPTSYIKTSGSTVTRNQETYTKTGISNLINSEEGVLFLEMAALTNDLSFRTIALSDGTTNDAVKLYYTSTSNSVTMQVRRGGSLEVLSTFAVSNITDFNKIAVKWKVNDFAMWIGGVEVATDTSGSVPIGMNRLAFDEGNGTSNKFFGKVKQLQVFKTALTDSELATLTT